MILFKRVLFTVLCITIFSVLNAQDDYEIWKSQQKLEMKKFISEQDKAFADFLENNWWEFETFKADVKDTVPKPVKIPEVEPRKIEEIEVSHY